jgi:hypothetical protein
MRQLGNTHISASISLRPIRSPTFCIVAMRDETQAEKNDSSWTNSGGAHSRMRVKVLNGIRTP